MILTTAQLEESLGERLRLSRYASMFNPGQVAELASMLREGVPPVEIETDVLLRWHAAYHPDSGPLRADTAIRLDELLVDEDRLEYAKIGRRRLAAALVAGRKPKSLPKEDRLCFTRFGW